MIFNTYKYKFRRTDAIVRSQIELAETDNNFSINSISDIFNLNDIVMDGISHMYMEDSIEQEKKKNDPLKNWDDF